MNPTARSNLRFCNAYIIATWNSFTFSDSEGLNRCRRRKYLLTSSADRHSIYFVKVQRTHLLDLSGKCFAILWNLRWAGSKFKTKIYLNSRLLRPSTFQMSWETKLWLFKYSWKQFSTAYFHAYHLLKSFIADSVQTEYCSTFHCSCVRVFVRHRRDISHFSHI